MPIIIINYSPNSVNFLDVTINKSPQGISTDVYCKPTDTHQYLLSDSCHPKYCKEAIAYSQALRIRRMCSTYTLYRKRSSELRQHLVSRGHSKRRVQLAINRALCTSRSTLLATRVNKKTLPNRVPLVTTYHSRLSRLSSIVNDNVVDMGGRCCIVGLVHLLFKIRMHRIHKLLKIRLYVSPGCPSM